jgi:hypothetical protein
MKLYLPETIYPTVLLAGTRQTSCFGSGRSSKPTTVCRFEGGSLAEIEGCLRRASAFHYIKRRGDF